MSRWPFEDKRFTPVPVRKHREPFTHNEIVRDLRRKEAKLAKQWSEAGKQKRIH